MSKFINMQLDADTIIDDQSIIAFTSIVANKGFTYNNGSFITNCSGDYIIVYHINIEGSVTTTDITITILVNGIPYHITKGNALVGQFSGSTTIHLNSGDSIQLKNTTGDIIEFTFGNITIYGT